jgi:hypothetical protein
MAKETIPELPTEERDTTMGAFIDAWSQLEQSLRGLIQSLSGATGLAAVSIAAAIPDNGRMRELLLALGALRLQGTDQKALEGLCERFRVANTFRNSIIHGRWIVTLDARETRKHPHKWARVYVMIDHIKEFRAVLDPSNPDHKKHVFDVNRIKERTSKALKLCDDFKQFTSDTRNRLAPADPRRFVSVE